MKIPWLMVLSVAVIALVGYASYRIYTASAPVTVGMLPVTTFEACVAAHYTVEEFNPARCTTPNGIVFTDMSDSASGTPLILPVPDANSTSGRFGIPIALMVGKSVVFTTGLSLTLKEVTDSRCPVDVVCVWAGEQGASFSVSGKTTEQESQVRLGMVTMPTLTQGGYSLTLVEVTTQGATITVTQSTEASAIGSISGTVAIGPICPVERIDNPCIVSPEVYTSRNVVVYREDAMTVIKRQPLSSIGTYALILPAGTYWLQIDPAGMGIGDKQRVVVVEGGTSVIDFDIDTGIR